MELHLPLELPGLLLPWYSKSARDLLWRRTKDPYQIWLSEIMLQQTRVEAVKEYYLRFLKTVPTVEALASIEEEKLLKLWEGLGYYSRARNLKKAAEKIVSECGGIFPDTYETILSLPGVGPYTAGAVASIAFELPTPAVDGNVMRVVARLVELDESTDLPTVRQAIEKALRPLYPKEGRGDFTQALMELGATVCLPNGAPKCEICPLGKICKAHKNDTTATYPLRSVKKARRIEERTVLILTCTDKIAIRKRTEKGLLHSLWELPNLPGKPDGKELGEALQELGVEALKIREAGSKKHIFTHVEWHMTRWRAECTAESPLFQWATEEELSNKYALPTAFKICLEQ